MLNSLNFLRISISIKIQQIILIIIEIIWGRLSFYPPSVKSFEKTFSCDHKTKYGLMFSNGTNAIEAAMFAVGINSKSIVGTTAFVIPSSYSSAFNLGAELKFLDIDPDTLNLDYKLLIKDNEPSITALVVTHFYGNPCDMELIMEWANKFNIKVIEDCSHAHGAKYKGRPVGTWGHIGIFSLQGSKTVSAGEGAIAVTNDDKYYATMAAYGHQESYKSFKIKKNNFNLPPFGYGRKMRAHPIGAVLASVDYKYLDHKNSIYFNWFKQIQSLSLESNYFSTQLIDSDAKIAGYAQGLAIILDDKKNASDFIKKLNDNRISCFRRNYIEALEYFGNSEGVPSSIDAFERVIFVPFYQFLDFRRWQKLTNILKNNINASV